MSTDVWFAFRIFLDDERAAFCARQDAFVLCGRGIDAMGDFELLDRAWKEARARVRAFVREVVR